MGIRAFSVTLCLGIVLSTSAIAPATAVPSLYDDFNDNSTNAALWTIDTEGVGPYVVETNQRLEVTLPFYSSGTDFWGGYVSRFKLRGDFDVQVDYELLEWPPANCTRVALGISGLGAIIRSYGTSPVDPSTSTEIYQVTFPGTPPMPDDRVVTTDMSGKMKLVRAGTVLTASYYSGGDWHTLFTGDTTTDDCIMLLSTWNHDSIFTHEQVKIAYDNFIVNSGEIVPVPEPSSLLALAGGLGSLGIVWRRGR